jgi:hypothetical protein
MKTILSIVLFVMSCGYSLAQTTDTMPEKKEFSIGLEFRPRTEYRNGYRIMRSDSSSPAFFTEQRSRINLHYKTSKFIFHTSIQNIHVWGEQDPRSTSGTLQVFEAFAETGLTKNISVRIGRQKIAYDNQRLFAQNDWRQNAGAHDAFRFHYKGKKTEANLIGAFNQPKGSQEIFSGTNYTPGFFNYKALFANFIKYHPADQLTFTLINASDGFQHATDPGVNYYRLTSGGRIEYSGKTIYATVAGYYQTGHNSSGKKVDAWYVQPELKIKLPKYFTFRLGAEILSGDDGTNPTEVSHSFDPLYGVNHRFLGSMDYFTRFPKDVNNAGLIAPYLFTIYEANKKLTLRADAHLFYSQNNFVVIEESDEVVIDKYLGFENDLLLIYKPNSYTEIQLGYSYGIFTESMEVIKLSGNSDLWQEWAYLMITFNPEIFRSEK